eukprot:11140311-Ditylum_brightwellii.AAC.1
MVEDTEVSPVNELDASMEGLEPPEVMLIIWILRKRALDGSKLVTLIEQGPQGVHYFCTMEEKKEEMIEYINGLENNIRSQFGYEAYEEATNGDAITCKFKKEEVKNARESAQAFT